MIDFIKLTKPGIIAGNLAAMFAGFFLASKHGWSWQLLLFTSLGLICIIASACVCNNVLDRKIDRKMLRTQKRPLAQGTITSLQACLFAAFLGVLGSFILLYFTNKTTFLTAALGFFIYVLAYSLMKPQTVYATAVGSVAGATPPVIGYAAVTGEIDGGAWILFWMLAMWQMPHFFSIALFRIKDYAAAGIPVLPIHKGIYRTKVHMTLYIIGFIISTLLLHVGDYAGFYTVSVITAAGIIWLGLSILGFQAKDDHAWSRQMFFTSLFVISAVSLMIPLGVDRI